MIKLLFFILGFASFYLMSVIVWQIILFKERIKGKRYYKYNPVGLTEGEHKNTNHKPSPTIPKSDIIPPPKAKL